MSDTHQRLDAFLAHPHRAVWTVSAPMMAGMVVMVLTSVIETVFVGRLGHEALAAQTLVFPLFFAMISIVNGIGTGITALVAQAIGRRDLAEAERIGGTAIAFGIMLGAAFALIFVLGGHGLLRHLGATAGVFELAWQYFVILALASPLMFVGAFLRFVLNGEGDSKTPMLVMLVVTCVNLVLDYLLIFRAGLGLRGAALAGALSQGLMALVMLYLLLYRRSNLVKLHWRNLVPSWSAARAVLAVGIPNSLTQLSTALGALLLNRVIVSFGDEALAAAGIGQRVDQVAIMPVMGLAAGSVAVIGMFAGAGRADLVRDTTWYACKWAVAVAGVLGVLAFTFSVPLMRAFTTDPVTIAVGRHYLLYMVFAYPPLGLVMITARVLLGLSYPNLSLFIVALRSFLLAVPIAYVSVFALHAPLDGVWAGILCGTFGGAALAVWLVWQIVWVGDPTLRASGRRSLTDLESPVV